MLRRKPIYGGCESDTPNIDSCACKIEPSPSVLLQTFLDLLNTLRTSIEKYLPAAVVNAPITGSFSTPLYLPPILMVRVLWNDRYPGAKPNKDDYFYRAAIRDLYFELNRPEEWANDPLSKL